MEAHTQTRPIQTLPITGNLTLLYALSLLVAILLALASLAGLLSPERLYPTEDLQESFLATDVGLFHTSDAGHHWSPAGFVGEEVHTVATFPPPPPELGGKE